MLEVEGGGSTIGRRTSEEFRARQAIFENCQEARNPTLSLFTFSKYSPYIQNENITVN